MKKLLFLSGFLILYPLLCFSQANFNRGEELFMQNKPSEAVIFLENSIIDDPAHVKAYLYLGIVYEQLGKLDEAIAVYRKVYNRAGSLSATVSSNLANVYFRRGNYEFAEQFYSQALTDDPVYSQALLGRANTRIKRGALKEAVADYELYIILEPRSVKRPEIERMINFIRGEFAAEERRKLLAEETAREEEQRRRRLMDEMSASLQSAASGSQGLSTGADNVENYESEFELQ